MQQPPQAFDKPALTAAPVAILPASAADEAELASYMMLDESLDDSLQEDMAAYLDDLPLSEKPVPPVTSLDREALQQRVSECQLCSLYSSRKNTVFGEGSADADVMIIGEAPGAEEDALGRPFAGDAGQLLDNMLKAIGLNRKQVFITNILKCHPPENRAPHVNETAACEAYLLRQIELIKPKIILSVGAVSAHNLLKNDEKVGKLRLQEHKMPGFDMPVHVTYHPAYLLRKPSEKAKVWTDLKKMAVVIQQQQ